MSSENTVHIAIELSLSSWLVAARQPGAEKSRLYRIEGGTQRLCSRSSPICDHARPIPATPSPWPAASRRAADGLLHRLLAKHGVVRRGNQRESAYWPDCRAIASMPTCLSRPVFW